MSLRPMLLLRPRQELFDKISELGGLIPPVWIGIDKSAYHYLSGIAMPPRFGRS
jgi:hypothetical protein